MKVNQGHDNPTVSEFCRLFYDSRIMGYLIAGAMCIVV